VFYGYDKLGRQIRVSSNKGDDVQYSYDIFGRLSTVSDPQSFHKYLSIHMTIQFQ
jgi:YD repeat-containing protein